jgi:undecaprenyl-diphosphatase
MMLRGRRRAGVLLALWAAAFVAAVAVDRPVAAWALEARVIPQRKKPSWVNVLKSAGDFRYVAGAIVVASLAHPAGWRAGAMLLTTCALSGLFYSTKWFFGRHRPSHLFEPFTFHPFKDGLAGVFYAQKLSFPSGHACVSFAAASGLAALFPRGAIAFYAVAVAVGIERVLEQAHYPSDVVAGAAFGVVSTVIAMRVTAGWFGPGWRDAAGVARAIAEPPPPARSPAA